MKKYKFSCDMLLRNRYKTAVGELRSENEEQAKLTIYRHLMERYSISNPAEFEKSIVVKEVDE